MVSQINNIHFADLEQEFSITRTMLESVPEEKYSWKPHEKSFSAGELAVHIANLLYWQQNILIEDHFDLQSPEAQESARIKAPATQKELLERFDNNLERLQIALVNINDEQLQKPWSLKYGEHTILTQPKAVVFRNLGVSHMVHHRGQLSVYLRLLGIPVPKAYGPTADIQ